MTVIAYFKSLITQSIGLSMTLFKIMVPIVIGMKILEELGFIVILSQLLEPVMELVGLPGAMGLVWATAMMSSLYGGMVVFASLVADTPMSLAQVTVVSSMMLMAHSLPIEARVAQKVGVRIGFVLFFRIAMAILFAGLLNKVYTAGDWLQQPVNLLWQPEAVELSLLAWVAEQLMGLLLIFVIVLLLVFVLDILQKLKIIKVITFLIRPALSLLKIGKEAETITLVGLTLGLSYGGALMIKEVEKGRVSGREVLFSVSLLGLCHSLIEDTLLMLLIGADLSGILFARIAFSIFVTYLLVVLINAMSSAMIQRYFLHTKLNE